ncbi:MAG: hypothetical protein ABJL99_22135 [Aliishimia sp.]
MDFVINAINGMTTEFFMLPGTYSITYIGHSLDGFLAQTANALAGASLFLN